MKTKRKVKLNWLSLTGLACFFLQEYQHVHLLWFKKRSFILVWKPNSPALSPRRAPSHSCWRGEYKPGSTHEALALKAPLFMWSVKSDSWYWLPWLCSACCMKQTPWSSLDHALAQVRPCQIFTRTFSKNGHKCDHFGRSLEPWYVCVNNDCSLAVKGIV